MTNMHMGRDLIINGSGSSGGGTFERVKINGDGRVIGDVACEEIKINGIGSVAGRVDTRSLAVHGKAIFEQTVKADNARVSGSASMSGDLLFKELHVNGMVDIIGGVKGDSIDLQGALTVGGDCETEHFQGRGGFKISGMLNSDTIDIKLYSGCRAREIGGSTIRIRQGFGSRLKKLFLSLLQLGDRLETETIEGDVIELAYTKADVVRGASITLGPGCSIGRVEYSRELHRDKGAEIGSVVKL